LRVPSSDERRIALVGLRGSGKTTLGELLARERGVPFRDLDRELELSPGEFLAARGLDAFRDAEARALQRVLAEAGPFVLATGGGVVESAANRELLAARAFVVWLRAAPEILAARVEFDTEEFRPALVPGGPLAEARELGLRRDAWYRAVARAELDTGPWTPSEAAARLAALLPGEV
jgi:shikimate kinase